MREKEERETLSLLLSVSYCFKLLAFTVGIFLVKLISVRRSVFYFLCLFRTQLLTSFSEESNVTETSLDQLRLLGSQWQDIKRKLDLLGES